MEPKECDYTEISALALQLGFRQAMGRDGTIKAGRYWYKGTCAEVDLTACFCSQEAIMKTAVEQFAQRIDEAYYASIELDLNL